MSDQRRQPLRLIPGERKRDQPSNVVVKLRLHTANCRADFLSQRMVGNWVLSKMTCEMSPRYILLTVFLLNMARDQESSRQIAVCKRTLTVVFICPTYVFEQVYQWIISNRRVILYRNKAIAVYSGATVRVLRRHHFSRNISSVESGLKRPRSWFIGSIILNLIFFRNTISIVISASLVWFWQKIMFKGVSLRLLYSYLINWRHLMMSNVKLR